MKKITFNNMAITEQDVMAQILQLEQERKDKERKKRKGRNQKKKETYKNLRQVVIKLFTGLCKKGRIGL